MAEITNTYEICYHCSGSGIIPAYTLPGQPGSSTTCFVCNGEGKIVSETIDVTILTQKLDQCLTELDYIHGKVTAIWNRVKPGGPP